MIAHLLVWFAIGACLGSFLNVCIHRMPLEQSIVTPGSRCPKCSHPIAWHDNIPILSYLALRARCRHCKAPIRAQYPIVELVTGGLTVAVVARFGVHPVSLVYLVFVYGLIVSSFIDLEHFIIPDEISLGGLALGLVISPLVPQVHGTASWWVALQR